MLVSNCNLKPHIIEKKLSETVGPRISYSLADNLSESDPIDSVAIYSLGYPFLVDPHVSDHRLNRVEDVPSGAVADTTIQRQQI